MTAITFPNSPSSGDTHTAGNGIVYTYDGEKWTSIGTNSAGTWTRSGTEVSLTNAGDDLNVDSGTLFVDASTDRVGVGTTSIDRLLHVQGAGTSGTQIQIEGTSASAGLKFVPASGDNWEIQASTASDFLVYNRTDEATRFVINGSGNVGIGTTSPGKLLALQDSSTPALGFYTGATLRAEVNATSAETSILSYANSPITFNVGGSAETEALRIDSSGRLLVGTSSARGDNFNTSSWIPQLQLEGTGDKESSISLTCNKNDTQRPIFIFAKTRGTAVGSDGLVVSEDPLGMIAFMGNDGSENVAAAYIQAHVDGTPGANDMPGRLSFWVAADGASSPTERMRIHNGGRLTTHSGDQYSFVIRSSNSASTSNFFMACTPGSSDINNGGVGVYFRIFTNGNVQNANNSYAGTSDIKLKENIVDASSQWDDIKGLRVRNYNFIEGQTHTQIGVIAQEVEAVSPGLVFETPDRDEEGNDLGTVTKSVNYSVLYMKAVKALQEAMERIETLETKVAAFEAS